MNGEFNPDLTFEDAMKRLEETVRKLESGELPLSESIERYREAMKLVHFCRGQLDGAQLQIEQLVESQGSTSIEPFKEGSV
jgi:exodeoxyribonuclease VII small subunit